MREGRPEKDDFESLAGSKMFIYNNLGAQGKLTFQFHGHIFYKFLHPPSVIKDIAGFASLIHRPPKFYFERIKPKFVNIGYGI